MHHRHECFHVVFVDEVPEIVDHLTRSYCTVIFATFILSKVSVVVNEV